MSFLYELNLPIYLGGNLAILVAVLLAFQKTKRTPFLIISVSAALGMVDPILGHLRTLLKLHGPSFEVLYCIQSIGSVIDLVCATVGTIVLTRQYVAMLQPPKLEILARPSLPLTTDQPSPQL
ncbi:MAG: hypothetical protein QM796_16335 [Chthoniobacteraceae bacterium]